MECNGFTGFEDHIVSYTKMPGRRRVIFNRHGVPLRLSASAYILLHAHFHGVQPKELASQLNDGRVQEHLTESQLERSLEKLKNELVQFAEKKGDRLPWGFWVRVTLINKYVARWLAKRLTFLFSVNALLVVAVATFYSGFVLKHHPSQMGSGSFRTLYCAYFLFLLSAVFHEIGHATASQRFGARPNDIGIAIYLVYLAFYSDVSNTWGLTPKKRVAVDLAGAYFQILIGDLFVLLYQFTGDRAFLIAVGMILISLLMCLNPIFKFDGYWTLTDLLDVGRLDLVPQTLGAHLWKRARRKPTSPLPWRGVSLFILSLYSICFVLVWFVFAARLLPAAWTLTGSLIARARGIGSLWRAVASPDWFSIFSLLFTFIILLSMVRIIYQFSLMGYHRIRNACVEWMNRQRRQVKVGSQSAVITMDESQSEVGRYASGTHK